MENGVEVVNGEKEMEVAVEGGVLKLESAAESKEENGVFEEAAMDSESFYTPASAPRHRASDSQESLYMRAHSHRALNSQESFYTPAYRHRASDSQDSQEAAFDAVESRDGFDGEDGVSPYGEDGNLADNLNAIEQNDVSVEVDARVGDQNPEKLETEKKHVFDCGEADETKLNGVVVDGMTEEGLGEPQDDGEQILENGQKSLTEEKPGNGEHNGAVSEEKVVNGVSLVATSDEKGVDSVTESKKETMDELAVDTGTEPNEKTYTEGVEQMVNDSVGSDSASDGQAIRMQREVVQPPSTLSGSNNGVISRSYASVVKEGTSKKKTEQTMAEGSSSGSKSEVRKEFDKESVLVEDLSDSSSMDDEGSSQPAPPARPASAPPRPESSGGLGEPQDDGEQILENGQESLTEEKPGNGEHNGAVSVETVENGVSLVVTSNEMGVDSVTESKKETMDELAVDTGTESNDKTYTEGVEQMVNDSVGSDSASDGQAIHMQREVVQPPSTLSGTNNGVISRSYASVVKEGTSERKTEQAKAEGSSSGSKSEVRKEFDRESVLVEDLSDSSSTDDEDSSQPAPPARPASAPPRPESSGGLSLPSRPAGLGTSAPLLEPSPRSIQPPRANSVAAQRQSRVAEEPANDDSEENDETREKLQMIRVKFLRLAHRLGQTPHNVVVAQVLYRLGLAEQLRRNTNRAGVFSFDRASVMAEQLESSGKEPLDFSCTIMVIGKTGVGKSATINSIFDEVNLHTDAFRVATKKVQEIVGTVQGIKVRIIDTPGLFPSSLDQWRNEKILRSVKKFICKSPPDIVLYFDRLDMQSRDYGDVPLLRSITDIFGSSIWFNAIIVLTHAASAPPDGPNGTPLSYEMFVSQRSHVVQQAIRQAAHDLRLMNPVSLVENHSACRTNRAGQRVLPNGQVWKPHLLLLSFASKILAEANMLLQLQDAPPGRPFGARTRAPPLPFFLSSLLQTRPQLKLPDEQFGDDFTVDEDLDEASDSDDGSEYDELPPFRTLNKSQLAQLSKAQRKAYFEELDYREKLFFRKQLKEERRRQKLFKKMAETAKNLPNDHNSEIVEDENSGPASVPIPMPDLALPTSFDSDNPTHRYRFLDTSNQWVVRPVLENHVWDHDVGYDGLNVERLFAIMDEIPVSVSGQFTKDKKDCTFQMELASSLKHGDVGATSLGLDMQTVGKDLAYTLRSETRIKNFRRNNTAVGASLTVLGDAMSAGMKIEDSLVVNKRFRFLLSGGAMAGRGDVAYGGRLEATLRDKDYPIGRALSNLALSIVDWHGDLAIGCNVQSQIPLGRGTNIVGHANVNNKGTGQVGIRLNSSDQLQIALFALLPIFRHVKRIIFGCSEQFD